MRQWHEKKQRRAEEQYEELLRAAKEQSVRTGLPEVKPPTPAKPKPLPASPTQELHKHFFNSLLFYAGAAHPLVKQSFLQAWAKYPNDPVMKHLESTKPFQIAPITPPQ